VCGGGSKAGLDNVGDGGDWRRAILEHLQNPGATKDQKVCRLVLKYTIMDDDLYR
jgi:hypothetical protein